MAELAYRKQRQVRFDERAREIVVVNSAAVGPTAGQ
jgi:hypothetical protein